MSLDVILQFIGLVGQKQWAAAVALVLLWVWHACQDWSKIPLKKEWQPVAFLTIGTAYSVIQATLGGMTWKDALFHGLGTAIVTYGLIQLTIGAIFGDKPMPKWLATILLLFPTPLPVPAPPDEAKKLNTQGDTDPPKAA